MTEETTTTVWVVMKYQDDAPVLVGVFSDEGKALAACIDWRYSIGPMMLNKVTPDTEWPGYYFLHAQVTM